MELLFPVGLIDFLLKRDLSGETMTATAFIMNYRNDGMLIKNGMMECWNNGKWLKPNLFKMNAAPIVRDSIIQGFHYTKFFFQYSTVPLFQF
jgi:hypothetical protein